MNVLKEGPEKELVFKRAHFLFFSHGYRVSWWLGSKPPYIAGGIGPMTWERFEVWPVRKWKR